MKRTSGYSLIELLVSVACGSFLLAAAVSVTTQHGRVLGRTTDRTDRSQAARLTLELISQDLRMAGVGVGYRPDGSFGGLARGSFTVIGGAQFVADNHTIALDSGSVVTDDLGIRYALGRVRTIADFGPGSGEICSGSGIEDGDIAILMTREGLHARTVVVSGLVPTPCSGGVCVHGCERFSWAGDTSYLSDSLATAASYVDGELIGDFTEVVWFVDPSDGRGLLRRAEIDASRPCAVRDATCGGVVATGVETLQVAVWQWDETNGVWSDRTTADVSDRDRVRIDVEVVVRGSDAQRVQNAEPVQLQLAPSECIPGPCGAVAPDGLERRVLRTSVEIRNAGRMQLK